MICHLILAWFSISAAQRSGVLIAFICSMMRVLQQAIHHLASSAGQCAEPEPEFGLVLLKWPRSYMCSLSLWLHFVSLVGQTVSLQAKCLDTLSRHMLTLCWMETAFKFKAL